MGLDIKQNRNGYTITNTISDEVVLKNGTLDEAKKYLMVRKIWKFFDELIEIEMEFPNKYRVNDKMHIDESKENFLEWWLENCKKDGFEEVIFEKMDVIVKKFNLGEFFKPLT